MTPFRSTIAIAVVSLTFAGALSACGGSDSKSSSSETSSVASAEGATSTTAASSTTTRLLGIDIVYKSCSGSTLTISAGNGEISSVEISRRDAAEKDQTAKMTKNADGTWTGTIPSGAGYDDRISVIVTSAGGKKTTRSSPLPLTVEDGTTSTCV